MKVLWNILLLLLIMASFTNCTSTHKLQKETPTQFGKVYCQSWVAGIQGGGSGLNLYIPIEGKSLPRITLDSVYFRGKVTKLEKETNNPLVFIGRFSSNSNLKEDIILSNEPFTEYGNKLPEKNINIPFELKDSECVVSYKESKVIKYVKIEHITEKELLAYPSPPPQNKQ